VTRPTSSMMPVNMDCIVAPASRPEFGSLICLALILRIHRGGQDAHPTAGGTPALLNFSVWVAQVSLDRKVFAEAVQPDRLHVCRLAHTGEAGTGGKGD